MQNATALFCADVSTPDDTLRGAAEAARSKNMHLAILLHAACPTLPMTSYGAVPYGSIAVPDTWPEMLSAAQADLKDRTTAIEALLADVGASADVRPQLVANANMRQELPQSTHTSDIVYFAPDLRGKDALFKEVLHGVLFHSPIAAMINGTVALSPQTVLLAWNTSLASARAAHLALPFLKTASSVHIVCLDAPTTSASGQIEPGREAAAWLSHHGCNVTLSQLPSGGREIGTCLLGHASEIGADLIVAGAYGHSRLQQAVFGGTSRTLIEQTDVAVLMAH